MTDIVTDDQLANSQWDIKVEYDPNNKPLPGTCLMTCLDYPVTYRFHWQILWTLNSEGTRWTAHVDCTDVGDYMEAPGIIVEDEAIRRESDLEVDSGSLGIELRDEFPWLGVVGETFHDLLKPKAVNLETITLENDHGPNYRFQGEQLAHVSSRKNDGTGSTRWTELKLYRTKGGKLICHELGMTLWDGEEDRYTVYLADDEASLIEKVGLGSLAKDLYDVADIDHAQEID